MHNKLLTQLKLFHQTAKVPLVAMVACSAAFGYFLARPAFSSDFLLNFFGVFFLACGAASFNSVQEKEADASYTRTRNRPIASGLISRKAASIFAVINCLLGLILLYFCAGNLLPMALGFVALVTYNLIYTPLKQVSEFALIPGGIVGAIPPYIGWTSAGGAPFAPLIWAVMALFFLWQPPHFCLILLQYAEDYRQKGNFTNLITRFSVSRVKKIIAIWLLSFLTIVLSLTVIPGFLSHTGRLILATGAPVFITGFLLYLFLNSNPRYKILFVSLNSFLFGIMTLLAFSSFMINE